MPSSHPRPCGPSELRYDIPDGQTRLHDRRGYARNGEEMPRKSKGARLYFDTTRGEWVIRDGTRFQRTGCPQGARLEAEQKLGEYIGEKYKPQQNSAPSIAEVLLAYWNEHLSHGASKRANKSTITNLTGMVGRKTGIGHHARELPRLRRPEGRIRRCSAPRPAIAQGRSEPLAQVGVRTPRPPSSGSDATRS